MDSKKTQCPKVLLLLPMVAWLLLSFNVQSSNAAPKVVKQEAPALNNPDNGGQIQYNNLNLSNPVDAHHRSKRFIGEIVNSILRPLLPTYYGTKWCGDNPRETSNIGNLGLFAQTDRCCQRHYICTQRMKQVIDYKYPNGYTGTFRSCYCDQIFHECLANVQPVMGTKKHIVIGEDYFNRRAPRCLDESSPIEECVLYQNPNDSSSRCISYKILEDKPERLVAIDNPRFSLETNLS